MSRNDSRSLEGNSVTLMVIVTFDSLDVSLMQHGGFETGTPAFGGLSPPQTPPMNDKRLCPKDLFSRARFIWVGLCV
jgi:hypothetical protein